MVLRWHKKGIFPKHLVRLDKYDLLSSQPLGHFGACRTGYTPVSAARLILRRPCTFRASHRPKRNTRSRGADSYPDEGTIGNCYFHLKCDFNNNRFDYSLSHLYVYPYCDRNINIHADVHTNPNCNRDADGHAYCNTAPQNLSFPIRSSFRGRPGAAQEFNSGSHVRRGRRHI